MAFCGKSLKVVLALMIAFSVCFLLLTDVPSYRYGSRLEKHQTDTKFASSESPHGVKVTAKLPNMKEPSSSIALSKRTSEVVIQQSSEQQNKTIRPTKSDSLTLSNPIPLKQKSNATILVTPSPPKTDDTRRFINPHEYKLLIDEPQACHDAAGTPKEVFLLVFILTIHPHIEQREAIRETWGSPQDVKRKKIVTLFLLARNPYAYLQQQVVEESNKHHDLIQEDFQDTYKNLTLKTIMGMKWASTHCPQASYVMKTDDDSYVSYENLIKHLIRPHSANYAVGCLLRSSAPRRDPKNKWYVSRELYPGSVYPAYLSGAGYVISGHLTGKIYEKSLQTRYLFLEDVFMAECLNSLNVRRQNSYLFSCWPKPYSHCPFKRQISAHRLQPADLRRIWLDQQRQLKC